jgi:CDP-paratose 2-epimerase
LSDRAESYTIFGYQGKQVRDNIHSSDLIACFHEYFLAPRPGEVYNIGGGRFSNASMLETIAMCEQISGNALNYRYSEQNRVGDHIWWISDTSKFRTHYPNWRQKYDMNAILIEIHAATRERAVEAAVA